MCELWWTGDKLPQFPTGNFFCDTGDKNFFPVWKLKKSHFLKLNKLYLAVCTKQRFQILTRKTKHSNYVLMSEFKTGFYRQVPVKYRRIINHTETLTSVISTLQQSIAPLADAIARVRRMYEQWLPLWSVADRSKFKKIGRASCRERV